MKEGLIDIFMLTFCIIILITFFPFKLAGRDILSLNPGGGAEFSVSSIPLTQGGGFFSEIAPAPPVSAQPSVNVPSGGGGIVTNPSVSINITSINLTITNNTYAYQYLLIKNIGTNPGAVSIYQINLSSIALIGGNSSFTLAPGASTVVPILFLAPQNVGIYIGSLIIAGQTIPVTLNVVTHLLMFDLDVQILNPNLIVFQGHTIQTQIKITPKGNITPMDVSLNYTIKSNNGTLYFTHSEVLFVENSMIINRNLNVGVLPLGVYNLEVDLTYPNGIAPSIAHFGIQKEIVLVGQVLYYLLSGIILLVIIFIVTIIISLNKGKNPKFIKILSFIKK